MMACPCCRSASRFLFRAKDRLFRTSDKEFELRECEDCRAVFLAPTPTPQEIATYYPTGYWWQTSSPSESARLWHKLLENYRRIMTGPHVRRVERLIADGARRPARLLDLGCGDGLFLASCRGLPLVPLGVDLSLDALRAARKRLGSCLITCDLEALPYPAETFRLVTLFHVLEHLPNPNRCLSEIHRVLEPGGWLVVQVPNAACLQRTVLGKWWEGFEVPRHLVNYSPGNLPSLLERHGFAVGGIDHFSLRDNPAVLARSLSPRLYPPARRVAVPLRGATRPLLNTLQDLAFLFLTALAIPPAMFESFLRRGASIVVEARKR